MLVASLIYLPFFYSLSPGADHVPSSAHAAEFESYSIIKQSILLFARHCPPADVN